MSHLGYNLGALRISYFKDSNASRACYV